MQIKNNEVVAGDMTGADVVKLRNLYDEIGELPYKQQVSLVELAYKRLKSLKVGLEVAAYEDGLYKETGMRAKGRPHR